MKYKFEPKIELSTDDKIVLKELIDQYFSRNNNINRLYLKVKLNTKLRKGYDFNQLDQRLHRFLNNPSILGIWHIYPEHKIFNSIDKVINSLKEMLITDLSKREFSAQEISEKANINVADVEIVLPLINSAGIEYNTSHGFGDRNGISKIIFNNQYIETIIDYQNLVTAVNDYSNNTYKKKQNYSKQISYEKPIEESIEIAKNTAFIIMQINKNIPELEDTYEAVKEIFNRFGIKAERADEIQHQERITDIIISKIHSSEYIYADLTGERPNIYYEIGYAHAIGKNPILYRKAGTKLHFDLSVHNVPEYKNNTELKELLFKRLEAIAGRTPK